jgi:hypothetical protein
MPKTLKEITSNITTASAPSMIPVDKTPEPPPKKEEPPPPDIKTLIKDKKDLLLLARLIQEDLPWKDQESQAKKARKQIEPKIKQLLGKHQVGIARLDDIRINYFGGTRTTLSEKLLLANGVPASVILASREQSAVFTLKITRGGDDEGED